jgi:hypothetical protein
MAPKLAGMEEMENRKWNGTPRIIVQETEQSNCVTLFGGGESPTMQIRTRPNLT